MNEPPDLCPRCGGGFVCGIGGEGPCPCTTVRLDEAVLAELRVRYAGCLCMRCLSSLSRERERVGVSVVPSTGADAAVRDAAPLYLSSMEQSMVVGGGGQVGRGWRGGQRAALSTARRPVRPQPEPATCPPPQAARSFRGRCAKPDSPLRLKLVGER